jgi:glycine betaine/proline transport system ATP-binding protein
MAQVKTGNAPEDNHIVAVRDVSFEIAAGECFVIMGLSGSGKSTLIRCVARLVDSTAGAISLDGQDILKASPSELIAIRRRKMSMVFQHFGLLPHLTVLDNVAYPLRIQGISRNAREARANELIGLVGLQGRAKNHPRELSGGQQQRVGIARSLAADPDIWLLDEPFSALDPLIRKQMQDEFLTLQRSLRKTIMFITHDFLEAVKLADRIAIMRNGAFVQVDRPAQLILAPADDYVAEFTRDVPRGQVLTAGHIAIAGEAPGALDGEIAAETLLDDLMERFVNGDRRFAVVKEDRTTVGTLTLAPLLKALSGARLK